MQSVKCRRSPTSHGTLTVHVRLTINCHYRVANPRCVGNTMARSIYSNLACWFLLLAICGAARAGPAQEAGGFWKRYEPGSIVISNHERRLCYVLGEDQAKCLQGRCRQARQPVG